MNAPQHQTTLAKNPHKAAKEMLAIIGSLENLYERENQYLETANTQGFSALQNEKMALASSYEQGIAQMIVRREEMQTLPLDIKNTLRVSQERFAGIAQQNKTLLERMERATQKLGETIRLSAKKAVEKRTSTGYTRDGGNYHSKTRKMSVGINETA